MLFKEIFRQPYLNEDDDFGGGSDDIIMPDDIETPSEEPTEPTEPVETPTTDPAEPKLKIKYNHEEKEITLDEAKELSQKGLNYDKLQEKYNGIANDPRLSQYDKVTQLAELYGRTPEEMVDALYNQYFETAAENQGLTVEQVKKEHELNQRENNVTVKETTMSQKEAEKTMYSKFVEAFPNVEKEEIKPETWAKVEAGMDLSTAFIYQQNSDLQAKIKTLETNAANAEKAPVGSVTAHGSAETTKDDFLAGFDSV